MLLHNYVKYIEKDKMKRYYLSFLFFIITLIMEQKATQNLQKRCESIETEP